MTDRVPLILDVDTGIDDALALLYAVASREAELVTVTCVAGNVPVDRVVANTRAVLALAGRADVPVVRGAATPLVKPLETTEETHGPGGIGHAVLESAPAGGGRRDPVGGMGQAGAPGAPGAAGSAGSADAADFADAADPGDAAAAIVRAARGRPGQIHLVTLGPLTNLALALAREPGLPGLLRGWTFMGGAFRVPGNTTPTSEWNLYVDPDAAKACLAAWAAARDGDPAIPLPLGMGLDVTERARIVPGDVAALARRAGVPAVDAACLADPGRSMVPGGEIAGNAVLRFVVDALRFYFEFHARYDGFYGAFIHDPFAVAATLDPRLVRTTAVHVDVETGPGLAHGMAVADWRGIAGRPPNVAVAVAGDGRRFIGRLVARVGALARPRGGNRARPAARPPSRQRVRRG